MEIVDRKVHRDGHFPRISYRLTRQSEVGKVLDRLVVSGALESWAWEYTDNNRAWFVVLGKTYDTAKAEAFVAGAQLALNKEKN